MYDLSSLSTINGYVALAVVAVLIAVDCRRDISELVKSRNVFLLTIIAWFLLEAIIVPDAIRSYSQGEYDLAILCIGVCVAGFLVGYAYSQGGAFIPAFRKLAVVDSPRLIWSVFASAVLVGFLPLVVIAQGNVLLILEDAVVPGSRWSSIFQRGRYGGARDAFLELQMFLRAAIPLAAAVGVERRQPSGRRVGAGLFLLFMFARAFNSGTRSQVVEVFLPIAAAIYWRMPVVLKRKAILFGLPIVLLVAMLWSAASVVTRNQGDFDWDRAADAQYVGFEMFRELLFLTHHVPDNSPYQFGYTYFTQAVNPIPRAIWPGKPDGDAGLLLAEMQGAGGGAQASLTVAPGLIGEMYWNFGLPGILFISMLLGFLAKSWDAIRPYAHHSILAFVVFAAGLAIIFLSGRSINMSTLYGMLALYVLLVFASSRQQRATSGYG